MLPDLRFVIGAALAASLIIVAGVGLLAAVKVAPHTATGPLETSRSLAFDDRLDWNQFQDPDAARRFARLTSQPQAAAETSPTASESPIATPAPVVSVDAAPAPANGAEALPSEAAVPVVLARGDARHTGDD